MSDTPHKTLTILYQKIFLEHGWTLSTGICTLLEKARIAPGSQGATDIHDGRAEHGLVTGGCDNYAASQSLTHRCKLTCSMKLKECIIPGRAVFAWRVIGLDRSTIGNDREMIRNGHDRERLTRSDVI